MEMTQKKSENMEDAYRTKYRILRRNVGDQVMWQRRKKNLKNGKIQYFGGS